MAKLRVLKKVLVVLSVLSIISATPAIWKSEKIKAAEIAKGGSAIENAVPITAGTYSGIALAEREETFYSISVKAGQELKVSGSFKVVAENETYGTNDTIEIFNDTKEKIASKFETAPALFSASALADSSKSTHTFYIRISDDTWGIESGEITVALNDRFDANSSTDAGKDFDSALSISPGSFKGYYSQVDTDDMYVISAKAGNFSAKIKPDKEASPSVKIFNASRSELVDEVASNGGEIVTAATTLDKDQNAYVQVTCDTNMGCKEDASEYSLEIGAVAGGGGAVTPENYDIVVPIVPTGGLTTVDSEVAPVLKKVFDDKVKLQKQNGNFTLIYIASRPVNAGADLQAIKAAMEGLGYKTKSISATQLVMTKGFKKLTFTVAEGSNKIEVKSSWIVSWLWLGVILGVIVLVVIVVIIIVVAKKGKKKPTSVTPASAPPTATPTPPTPPTKTE